MTTHFLFLIELLISSLLFALLEIQIEGDKGWAEGLPTWRIKNRLTDALFSRKPLTGYHVYAILFIYVISHATYVLGGALFSVAIELRILAFVIGFWLIEDFLWFILNPAFGLKKFRPEHVWWHRETWWRFMPRDYWIGLPLSVGLYWLSWR